MTHANSHCFLSLIPSHMHICTSEYNLQFRQSYHVIRLLKIIYIVCYSSQCGFGFDFVICFALLSYVFVANNFDTKNLCNILFVFHMVLRSASCKHIACD